MLNTFLTSPKRNATEPHSLSSSDDEDMSTLDSEIDDMDYDDADESLTSDTDRERQIGFGRNERLFNQVPLIIRDLNNNIINNNPSNRDELNKLKTVEENITNLNELKVYPGSLKNLTRIRIKDLMPVYNPSIVEKLPNLPESLKKFLVFQDEIDLIKKLTINEINVVSN
jgi:hypothetical protein